MAMKDMFWNTDSIRPPTSSRCPEPVPYPPRGRPHPVFYEQPKNFGFCPEQRKYQRKHKQQWFRRSLLCRNQRALHDANPHNDGTKPRQHGARSGRQLSRGRQPRQWYNRGRGICRSLRAGRFGTSDPPVNSRVSLHVPFSGRLPKRSDRVSQRHRLHRLHEPGTVGKQLPSSGPDSLCLHPPRVVWKWVHFFCSIYQRHEQFSRFHEFRHRPDKHLCGCAGNHIQSERFYSCLHDFS